MAGVLIIGCGNPLRGDDGLAWHALAQLERESGVQGTEMISCHQLMPELAEHISGATRVIFIDARVSEGAGHLPGTIDVQEVEAASAASSPFGHHLDPSDLLGIARRLYGSRPEAFAASVVGKSFGYSEELSSPVRAALPELVGRVVELVNGSGEDTESRGTKPECSLESTVAMSGSRP